jgi:hypothetical protein
VNECESLDDLDIGGQTPVNGVYPLRFPSIHRTAQYGRTVYRQSNQTLAATITTDSTYFIQGAKSLKCVFTGITTGTWIELMKFNLPEKLILKNEFTLSMYILSQANNTKLKWEQDNTAITSNEIKLLQSDYFVRHDAILKPWIMLCCITQDIVISRFRLMRRDIPSHPIRKLSK